VKIHPVILVLPWALIIAELDYAAKKRTRRRAKRLQEERQMQMQQRSTRVVG
jgi:hypothetical protein